MPLFITVILKKLFLNKIVTGLVAFTRDGKMETANPFSISLLQPVHAAYIHTIISLTYLVSRLQMRMLQSSKVWNECLLRQKIIYTSHIQTKLHGTNDGIKYQLQ